MLIKFCLEAGDQETGGILIGRYTEDCCCAEVTEISGLPCDSFYGHSWLFRGIKGLGSWLHSLWNKRREYYLGEWHYHPSGAPNPSQIDRNTMYHVACSHKSLCPEPVLVIIGFKSNQILIDASVFTEKKGTISLGTSMIGLTS